MSLPVKNPPAWLLTDTRLLARFHGRYVRGAGDACWEMPRGNGVVPYKLMSVTCGGVLHAFYAHRFALALRLGRWPEGHACHSCDNPVCVNPAHLWEGTHEDNMRDRGEKLRARKAARRPEAA